MKHLFIPYELAVKLKEKGFDEPCAGYFKYKELVCIWDDDMNPASNSDVSPHIAAPLYQQVTDWFKDVHKIHVCADLFSNTKKYCATFVPLSFTPADYPLATRYLVERAKYSTKTQYDSFYEALNAAIIHAIKLI